MRSFWFNYNGENIQIIFKLIKNGRWWYHSKTNERIGVEFDYPPAEDILGDSEIRIADVDLEELDPAVRSMLFQTLQIDAPEFNASYS
jgi:hypothetical protein